ncbi:hypothetical protein QCA50_013423 [Cerrena zonata]|uniref:BZIP domain-containing protein n=1 Tax=Cerrena zonata TaxID=2478898 RepID=A0AAW0FXG6_9APHY
MTPLSSTSRSSPDHQSSTSLADRPERSRNAKAQARHRAKRKAYIEQLEQTVTKLQYALAYTPEQIAALPPPLMRIRELEEKVGVLVRENEELRRQLEQRNADLRPDIARHPSYRTSFDDRHADRDIKRRRTIDHGELYVDQTQHQLPTPPPPLTIPQQYGRHERAQQQILSPYTAHMDYPIAETPSDTSSASSPSAQSFSPISEQYSNSLHHRPSSSSSNQTVLPSFSNAVGPYSGLVKIEEDAYIQHHGMSPTNNYYTPTLPPVQHLTHWR